MKFKILILLILFSLMLPVGFSIIQDPRTLVDVWYYVPNYTHCTKLIYIAGIPYWQEGHCENNWFFVFTNETTTELNIQLLPAPNMTCFWNNENCPQTGFSNNMTFEVSRIGNPNIFQGFLGWISSGFGSSSGNIETYTNHSLNVSLCWNWWNTTDKELRNYQKSLCPTTSISFKKYHSGATFESFWAWYPLPSGTAQPDIYMVFKGYGGKWVNMDETYNSGIQTMFTAIRNFMDISVSLWRIIYYLVIIGFIIGGLFMVLGVLPMGLRWIIKKITED